MEVIDVSMSTGPAGSRLQMPTGRDGIDASNEAYCQTSFPYKKKTVRIQRNFGNFVQNHIDSRLQLNVTSNEV